jgi:hypothetical protein
VIAASALPFNLHGQLHDRFGGLCQCQHTLCPKLRFAHGWLSRLRFERWHEFSAKFPSEILRSDCHRRRSLPQSSSAALHGPRGRDNMKRGYRTGWRTWKGPEQERPPRACSKELLNLAVVVSFRHALSVASLPRLRFVRLVGLPASRMSRATVSASSTLDSMSRLSAPCARVSFEAAKYCEVPAMRPVAPRRSCTNFPSAHGIAPEAIVCASLR